MLLEYKLLIQRIKSNLDQELAVFSQNPELMVYNISSFCVIFSLFFIVGASSLFADNIDFTDSIPPSPTINAGSLEVGGPFTVGIGFNEKVFGLTIDDFSVENGEVMEVAGEEMNYTVLIDPLEVGIVRFKIPAGVVVDEAGNENLPSGTLTVNFTDEEPPTVVLSTPQNMVNDVFPVNIIFNEPVSGLEISDFNISNGAGVDLTGSIDSYTLSVNPGAVGAVSIFLPSDVVVDTAGNPNLVSNFLQVNFGMIDTTAPVVELSTATTEVSEDFIIEIRSSEEIIGLELDDFSVVNAEISDLSGNGNVFTALVTTELEGEIRVQLNPETIVDLFDNPNEASNELIVNFVMPLAPDTIRPEVFLEEFSTGVDGLYEVNISFSELVTELSEDDLVLNNGVITSFVQVMDDYEVEFMALDFGLVNFSLPENIVTDPAGNGNLASSDLTFDFVDNTPTNSEPILDITLSRGDNAIQVTWFTNTEVENASFEIWHSGDGINFSTVTEIESNSSNPGLVPYNFAHETPVFGMNHYFVRQFDQEGSFVDSETAIFDFLNLNPDALIYPNPAADLVTFNTSEFAGIRCEVMIYNALGQIFLLDVYDALPISPLEIDISDYQEGVYGVQFWIQETARVESSFVIIR